MSKFKNIKQCKALCIFLSVISILSLYSFVYLYQWRNSSGDPIRSDGWGYYSYLPAVFDYGDMTFQFSDDPSKDGIVRIDENGNYVNKYPVGTALMELPFFAVADIGCKIFNPSLATGYTKPYQIAIIISTYFYFILGLILLFVYLRKYFSEKIVMWTLVTMVFATNLFHYATFDASFSHIYSFCLITAFVYVVEMMNNSILKNFLIGFLAGMILITRNPNAIIVLFYLFYRVNDAKSMVENIKDIFHPLKIVFNILGALIPVSIQCGYWFYATGKIVIRSYDKSETFSWLFPHLINVLFSVSKGMLFYAPVLGLAFCGIWVMKKRKLEMPYLSVLLVLILDLYITSCWDCWQYGGSLGQRPFIDFYCLFALLLACSFDFLDEIHFSGDYKITTGQVISFFDVIMKPVLLLMILVAIKFMLAYWHGILPFADATMSDILNSFNWNFHEMRNLITEHMIWL